MAAGDLVLGVTGASGVPYAVRLLEVLLRAGRTVHLTVSPAAAEAGAVVLPAMPAFYTRPASVSDMVDFVVGRVCDQLGVEHGLLKRWGEPTPGSAPG